MTTYRDLYQEIEDELRNSADTEAPNWTTVALMLLAFAMVLVIFTSARILLRDSGTDPVTLLTELVQGTATPTVTPVPTETPLATATQPLAVAATAPISETVASVPVAIEPASASPTSEPQIIQPTLPPTVVPTPTRDWSVDVSAPVPAARHYTSMSLSEIQGRAMLDISVAMGYTDAGLLDELGYVRALTSGFIDDSLINADLSLHGVLPHDPMFLFVGQMAGPGDFSANAGTLSVKLPYGGAMVNAQLSSDLLQQVENASLVVNGWQVKGGWVWFLGTSPALVGAIDTCRDSSESLNVNYGMPNGEGECDTLTTLLGEGTLDITVAALMGLNADGNGLTPLLPEPLNPITNRWIYADFGRYSAQLALPDDVRGLVQELGMNYGLVRADWQNQQLVPNMLLNAAVTDGLYLYDYQWTR